jgi:hypothetical protein
MSVEVTVNLHIPGMLLDKRYEATCTCGVYKDFGYMHITADHWADRHRERGEHHNVTLHVSDAPPIERLHIDRKLFKKKMRQSSTRVV